MIKFRRKNYTLSEGHYTGPKDMDDVPSALSVVGASTLAGMGIGGLVGHYKDDLTTSEGVGTGAKVGFVAGVGAKVLLNVVHNPMSEVKYQKVDQAIRRRLGMVRVAGITVGDTRAKRHEFDDKFGTNDKDVEDYKINIAIQNNTVTMYTQYLSEQELKSLDRTLDYFCKKYYGMKYTSQVMDAKNNSYSVNIIFTNYEVISDFLLEVSDELGYKINLLNDKALVDNRLSEKQYSGNDIGTLDKYDLLEIFSSNVLSGIHKGSILGASYGATEAIVGTVAEACNRLSDTQKARVMNVPMERNKFTNDFLLNTLRELGYIEGIQYTHGESGKPITMYLSSGVLLVAIKPKTKEETTFNKIVGPEFTKSEVPKKGTLYKYTMTSRQDLKRIVSSIIKSGIKPNIYNP